MNRIKPIEKVPASGLPGFAVVEPDGKKCKYGSVLELGHEYAENSLPNLICSENIQKDNEQYSIKAVICIEEKSYETAGKYNPGFQEKGIRRDWTPQVCFLHAI